MVRKQIQLTQEQLEAVQQLARRDREELKRRSLASMGAFRSNLDDLATNHDLYLEAPVGEGRP